MILKNSFKNKILKLIEKTFFMEKFYSEYIFIDYSILEI